MQAIFDALGSIGQAIVSFFQMIIGLFQDLIYVIGLCGKFLLNIPTYFSFMPGEVIAILAALFGVIVVYKVLGREG